MTVELLLIWILATAVAVALFAILFAIFVWTPILLVLGLIHVKNWLSSGD